jgi:PleD family two-component response regulator
MSNSPMVASTDADRGAGDDADTLLRAVDKALYTAKALGRNCVSVASADLEVATGVA